MGCAASTAIANGDDEVNLLKQQLKNDDDVDLTRTDADTGDLSVKDANFFGDQLDLNQKVADEDTNFHNSPSNITNEPISVISNNIEISTNPGRLSAVSSVSRNEDATKTKLTDNTTGDDELQTSADTKIVEKHNEATSQKALSHSLCSSHQSPIYKPTVNSSDDEESRMSTKISQDLSKQNDASVKSKSESSVMGNQIVNDSTHNSENTLSKETSIAKSSVHSDFEKSGKDSRSSHTLTGSNRSQCIDSGNANADNQNFNQNHDVLLSSENILMGTGDINQNHQLITMSLLADYCKNECLSIQNENMVARYPKDLSATGDIGLEKLNPSLEDNSILEFGINELQNDLLHENGKNMSLSRTSQISAISRQSSNTPSFNHGYLKTAEVNDTNFEIESLNAFEMKDMTVDYNQEENGTINLSECNNDIATHPENEDSHSEERNKDE